MNNMMPKVAICQWLKASGELNGFRVTIEGHIL